MADIDATPYDLLPEEWAFHPEIGPFMEWLLNQIDQTRRRTGGDFDQVDENASWKFPVPAKSIDEDSPGPPLPPRMDDEPPVIDVIGVAAARSAREALEGIVPIGGIIIWSGAVAGIPDNYQVCDGTNGTPDLRDRFVIGAGSTYAVDDTGGGAIAATMGANDNADTVDNNADGTTTTVADNGHVHTITVSPNLPPYYALAYIQRLE